MIIRCAPQQKVNLAKSVKEYFPLEKNVINRHVLNCFHINPQKINVFHLFNWLDVTWNDWETPQK